MKNLYILLLGIFGFCQTAHSITPRQVEIECERQMSMGICFTRVERSTISPEKTMVISGAGRVLYTAYLDYIDKYDANNPKDFSMCRLALYYMVKKPGSDHDKIARAMWSPVNGNSK
jgi:hypothetical protein